jgi:hypothetical protein
VNFRIAHIAVRIWDVAVLRGILQVVQIAILSALIVATRCANYPDIFVAGNVHFVDADCYARMMRVRMVSTNPGLIVRHHSFENFPQGTTPHTTAPLDYLIFALSLLLKPFTAHALDMAGAFVSPLLALVAGWFLWWWSCRMKFRYRWVMLILYGISPILVHGTELGRPDHQSLAILLVAIAICAQWSSRTQEVTDKASIWWLTSAAAWALAIWVSAYEPLVLFVLLTGTMFVVNRQALFAPDRSAGWICFAAIIAIAVLIEERVPSFATLQSSDIFKNWAGTVGELAHVSPANPAWLRWCGFLLLVAPFLIWRSLRTRTDGATGPTVPSTGCAVASSRAVPVCVLLIATYLLTIWQARWGYFFVLMFALALPALLTSIKSGVGVWIVFVLSLFPILRDWDERLWPSESQLASRVEQRIESADIRELAFSLRSSDVQPFLAPWWLSPSIAYWSGQPGIAGSSHESLSGIKDSAQFFVSENLKQARDILEKHRVTWVFAYDSERVAHNSAAILKEAIPQNPLCSVLDRTPSRAPHFLLFSAQTQSAKLYRVSIGRSNEKTFH